MSILINCLHTVTVILCKFNSSWHEDATSCDWFLFFLVNEYSVVVYALSIFIFPPNFEIVFEFVSSCLFIWEKRRRKQWVVGRTVAHSSVYASFWLTLLVEEKKSMQSTFSNHNIEFIEFFMEIYQYWILYKRIIFFLYSETIFAFAISWSDFEDWFWDSRHTKADWREINVEF